MGSNVDKTHKSAWEKITGVIATVAPGLATALGGPLAGQAVGAITSCLGLGPNEEEQAIKALSTSPDALLKLKLAEIDFQKFLQESGIKLEELDVTDRASARDLAKTKTISPQVTLSIIYTLGYFGLLFGLASGALTVPTDAKTLVDSLLTMLAAPQLQILNFWFGSSHGSQSKDAHIAELTK